jgi:hypothetical protein
MPLLWRENCRRIHINSIQRWICSVDGHWSKRESASSSTGKARRRGIPSGGDSRTESRKVGRSEYEKEWEGERRHPKVVLAAGGNQGSPESRWKGWPVSGVS